METAINTLPEATTENSSAPYYQPGSSTPPQYHPDFTAHPWALALLKSPNVRHRRDWLRCDYSDNTDTLLRRTVAATDSFRAYAALTQYHPETGMIENLNLISLGTDLNAHQNLLHGGIVATLLDEIVGAAAGLGFTAYLNVSFKKPVKTPAVVLLRSRVVKQEGRKIICAGSLEDGMGGMYASAEGMYVQPSGKLKL
ncbi:HotDog domain-containing protein [Sphaerosporella brunnea]|uniref:HotDog domain-containing protein n=1 Tax=Sphaerosporella brunnea TaxID=1250544 RepID=A0A5J5EHW2_9PEZI|nr:HotDog domain-containing protein [Sphaerosporella brunnea]